MPHARHPRACLRPVLRSWLCLSLFATAALSALGQITRVANTTLTLPPTLQTQTLGYRTEVAFPGISFNQPLGFATPPGETNRVFVLEKPGRIQVVSGIGSTPVKSLFLDLSAKTLSSGEEGLLGLAFHPAFATNRYFYVFYTTTATTSAGTGRHDRLSRFTALAAPATNADILATEVPLISQFDEASNHNGGDIHFGADGYLYVALGDEGGGNDQYNNSQRIDKDFFAGLLRIDVDQRAGNLAPNPHPAVHAGTYSVPADNPFVGATSFNGASVTPANVRTEFWAVGLRNPWRFSFDTPTGRLFTGDVGQGAREEINLITKGGNYGWSYREGSIAGPRSNPPAGVTFVDPIWDAGRSVATSITGGVVYRGTRFSQLTGQYIFGDYPSGRIFAMSFPSSGPVQVQELLSDNGPAGFGADPSNGDVLIASLGTGAVRRLVQDTTPVEVTLPATLSATGAFSNLATLTPHAGLVAYEPNVAFWSDHATKRRWFSVPGMTERMTFSADGNWTFPAGTVWVKHFDLNLTRGDPATARRVETRFLVKTADGVYGLTYRWNAAQTEATLVPAEGASDTFNIVENGNARTQTWRYPSRSECLQCHTAAGGYALSFNTAQLNRPHGNGPLNQLRALADAGYIANTVPDPSTLRALARADDASATVEHRARSYLAANCVQCHQPGGTAQGNFDARISTPTANAGLINGALVNHGGDPANRVIAAGDVAHSMLLTRLSSLGMGRMPPVTSSELDAGGIALITSWIQSLQGPAPEAPVIVRHPANQTVTTGRTVTIAAGSTTGSVRWQTSLDGGVTWSDVTDDGTHSGAATGTLTLANVPATFDGRRYRLVATNGGGSATSGSAMLRVRPLFFPSPVGLARTPGGDLLVADSTANTIQRVTAAGEVTILAGASGSAGSADGTGTTALFNQPVGIAVGADGTIFVADTANSTLRRITPAGVVTTLAGSPNVRGNTDGTGAAASFSEPAALAIAANGNIFVADSANHTIRRVTPAGVVSTFAGGAGLPGATDGTGGAARFNRPSGLAIDSAGNLFVADTTNNTLRRITPEGQVTTLAGVAGVSGASDGAGDAALFNRPTGLSIDGSGNLFVADTGNSVVRRVTPAGVVTTRAGLSTIAGHLDGTGSEAWFNQPRAVAVDGSGGVHVADTGNAILRHINPGAVVVSLALSAGTVTPPPPPPPPPPTTQPPTTPPPSSGGGGGGGAVSGWFLALLSVLTVLRFRRRS